MNPRDVIDYLQRYFDEQQSVRRKSAMKYIEDNVDLIDVDLQQFMDNCPDSCHLEVYEMLLKAGIDMGDYVFKDPLKQWTNYIHDANLQSHKYYNYTAEYKKEFDEYIDKTIRWNPDWRHDAIVLDTIPAVKEA